jgi:ankyrin repeat protein
MNIVFVLIKNTLSTVKQGFCIFMSDHFVLTLENVKEFIASGQDLNHEEPAIKDYGHTTKLMDICSYSSNADEALEMIRLLINKGANVNYQTKYNGGTALIHACCRAVNYPNLNFFPVVQELLNLGADTELADDDGYDALEYVENLSDCSNQDYKKLKKLFKIHRLNSSSSTGKTF